MRKYLVVLWEVAALTCLAVIADGPPISTGTTTRVSVSSSGEQANGVSYYASISGNRHYVAFQSSASNLVPNDTNNAYDIFVHDLTTRRTERVSVTSDGLEADGESGTPSISADGRRIAFASTADNLAPERTFEYQIDVYVHDRDTGKTILASRNVFGLRGNSQSPWDLMISADGRFVAFSSDASDLISDDTNGTTDVFVYDLETDQLTRVSVSSTGAQGNGGSRNPSISADGRYVAFGSMATNLVPGSGQTQAFVHDTHTGQTIAFPGKLATPRISPDGRYVALMWFDYHFDGYNWVELVLDVWDMTEGRWISSSLGRCTGCESSYSLISVSWDAARVAFSSDFPTLVEGDLNGMRDVFVYDRPAETVVRVSKGHGATEANGVSSRPSISSDGRLVAFHSLSNNLVADDTNAQQDIFVYDATDYDHVVHLPLALKVFQQ